MPRNKPAATGAGPIIDGAGLDAAAPVWSVEEVRLRLEDAGRTLMALPMPRHALPKDDRSRWPEVARGMEDAFAALVGAGDEIRQDFTAERNEIRVSPSARAVGRLDATLAWLWYLADARKRRLCMARALIHPASERHMVSYRKLGRIFGLHHDTVRIWHDRALSEIAQALTRDEVPKTTARPKRGTRKLPPDSA